MRLLNTLTISMCCCLALCPIAVSRAQEGANSGAGLGGEGQGATDQGQREYEVKHVDGSSESGTYVAYHTYALAPGWAKPRRWHGYSEEKGGGYSYLGLRSGQSKSSSKGEGRGGVFAQNMMPVNSMFIVAIVLAKGEDEARSRVIVGQHHPKSAMGGMGEDFGGMAGVPGAMGGGMGMGGGGMGMGGGESMGAGMMGGMGGMMGGGMGDMMGESGPAKVRIVPLEECRIPTYGRTSSEPKLTVAQLKNLAELVRVDCWIEEELATLREVRQDAEKFKVAENSLKELLSNEYELQLNKQREDIERLNEKLKALQGELARRASAQDRVVDVQLGQLILEAQGLIGERP